MPPRTTTSKPTQTTTKRTLLRSKPAQVSPDELADKLAAGLTISKGKAKQNIPTETPEERRVASMRAVNAALQGLSSLVQSGWKASTAKPPTVRSGAGSTGPAAHVTPARTFLKNLRIMTPGDLDVEKAALSVVGKLIVLELYYDALEMLSDVHSHFLQLYEHDALPSIVITKASKPTTRRPTKPPLLSYLVYLSLPLPLSESAALVSDLLNLISTYLSHATTAFTFGLFASEDSALADTLSQFVLALHSSPSLISWIPLMSQLPSSHIDSILTRAYTVLTKSSARTQKQPQHVFQIRYYALLCLLYTSPTTVAPNTFWDQLVKFAVAFARSTPALWLNGTKDEQDEAEATDLVLSIFSEILGHAEKRIDSNTFLSGKSFVAFCDYWLGFAKKAGDIRCLDKITALVHGVRLTPSPGPSVELCNRESPQPRTNGESTAEGAERGSPDSSSKSTKRYAPETSRKLSEKVLQLTKLGTSFVQAGAYLESGEGPADDFAKRMRDIIPAIESFRRFCTSPDSLDKSDEYLRVEAKVDRALERLRRACLKLLDRSSSIEASAKLVKAVLIEIVSAFAAAIQVRPSAELYTSTLDTCFTLARTSLAPSDPRTHDAAYGFLSQAADTLGLELKNSHEYDGNVSRPGVVDEDTFANYVRCLSGAFHNLAGILYQADKHGTSIRFLRQACVLGNLAVRLRDQCSTEAGQTDEGNPKRDDAWKQLDDQLSRRWELLGVCYSKICDRKLAYDAFVESIVSYVFPTAAVQHVRTHGPNNLFETLPGLKQIGNIIDRITYMATCELLRSPGEVSLKRTFEHRPVRVENRQPCDQQCILGVILERQMASLEGSRWKDGVKDVIAGLLSDALLVYDVESRPIRRAAVMLRCFEFTYYSQAEDRSLSCLPLRTEEYGQHIDALLANEVLGHDVDLAPMRSPYQAAAHLWLALHCHRINDVQQSQLVIRHIQDACHLMRHLFMSQQAASAQKSPEHTTKGRKALGKGLPGRQKPAAIRGKAVAKTRIKQIPMTPKPTPDIQDAHVIANGATSILSKNPVVYDNFRKIADLIRMNIHLLGLLGHVLGKVQLLRILRRLCEQYRPKAEDDYVVASIDLAHEYVKLGKTEKAGSIYNHVFSSVSTAGASEEIKALFFLRYAESLSLVGDISRSSGIYCEALSLYDSLDDDEKGRTTAERVRTRVEQLERAALASNSFATIQLTKDDPTASLNGYLQSLRLWNRAMSTLERLRPPTPSQSIVDNDNPFDVSDLKKALPSDGTPPPPDDRTGLIRPQPLMHGLEWRIADGLLTTLFGLAHNYASRGSAREAEYFAEQAHELAVSLNAPIMICRALAKTGELQLQLGELDKGHEALLKAAESLKDVPGPDAADIRRLHAEYSRLNAKESDALQLYSEAAYILDELNKMFSTMDGFGIRRSTIVSKDAPSKADALVPQLVSSVLREHIWLLRDDVGEEYQLLLDKFMALPASMETKAEEHTLIAKLTLHDAYDCFREDMFLNSLTESTIALPLGMSVSKSLLASSSVQGIMETLTDAEKLFWLTLSATSRRGRVSQIREVANSLALIQAYTTSLGGSLSEAPVLVSNLLDMSVALTLRRELLEVIQGKFPLSQTVDDLRWPSITSNGSPIAPVREQRKRRFESRDSSDGEDDAPVDDDSWLQDYWSSVEKKCRLQSMDADSLIHSKVDGLPENWTVINISVTDDKSSMFITRQRARHAPVVFCLPLKGRRENEGDEHLTYSDAVEELKEIIRLNDEGTKQAIHVKNGDKDARAAWWANRTTLDKRLQELLENMEFCWLGAFKTILSPPANICSDVIADLHSRLDKVFKRGLVSQDKKQKTRIRLDDSLVECFSMLSSKCRDEELEDLIYFIFDLYQFHGVQVAIAEVDIDQLVVDLRTALEEHTSATKAKDQKTPQEDSHMFLVLDKNAQAFPWESIPILRGQSVSRIPSIDFLIDRLELVKCKRKREGRRSPASEAVQPVDRLEFNATSAYYVLNPSGDLGGTEKRFASWLTGMHAVGWKGVIGRVPSEQQMLDALSRNDLFIYFGHGGAEQYVRSHKIRHLPKCAATMLWGCSSGLLKDMGDFDRIGTPNNYMLAGCPTLVSNLWDVTDRDIDKFSQAVFDEIHLTPEHVGAEAGVMSGDATSVVAAVAKAREVCKLKYLTGAAPVIYGIPFYL